MRSTLRSRGLTAFFGGPLGVDDDGRRLTIRYARRDGCAGAFMLMWLSGWGFGTVVMAREIVTQGVDLQGAVVWAVMAAVGVAIACVTAYKLLCREILTIDRDAVQYVRRVIVPVKRQSIDLRQVRFVELHKVSVGRRGSEEALFIAGDSQQIWFARRASTATLVNWAHLIRTRIERDTHKKLEDAPNLVAAENEARARTDRITSAALASVGARSVAELKSDPQRFQAAAHKARELSLEEAMTNAGFPPAQPETPARRISGWFAATVWAAVGIAWILGTVGITVQTVVHRRWGNVCVLVPCWGISLFFAFVTWAIVRSAIEGIIGAFRG